MEWWEQGRHVVSHAAALVAVFKLANGFPYAQTFSKYFTWIVSFSFITILIWFIFPP